MRTNMILILSGCAALLLASCGVKDPIFNTSHPGHGMVTLTTDWSGIGAGLAAPDSYKVDASLAGAAQPGYTATLTGVTNKLDHLFEPGTFRFRVYNTPEGITVDGTVASVMAEVVTPSHADRAAAADEPVYTVQSTPGWFFTCVRELAIAADSEYTLTAPMEQQVRQLTLVVEPKGGSVDRIESIVGMLTGVAGTYDFDSGTYGAPSKVMLNFKKITEGVDAGKWTATVRLLGVTGSSQLLSGAILFVDDIPQSIPLGSDLTTSLAGFNADKRTPLTLYGEVVQTPDQGNVAAMIDVWTPVRATGSRSTRKMSGKEETRPYR